MFIRPLLFRINISFYDLYCFKKNIYENKQLSTIWFPINYHFIAKYFMSIFMSSISILMQFYQSQINVPVKNEVISHKHLSTLLKWLGARTIHWGTTSINIQSFINQHTMVHSPYKRTTTAVMKLPPTNAPEPATILNRLLLKWVHKKHYHEANHLIENIVVSNPISRLQEKT